MDKLDHLRDILKRLKSVVVAYSGGLDSTFLLKVAIDTLGRDKAIAVIARSETYPLSEYKEAVKMARHVGAKLITIHTDEMNIKNFRSNPVARCYYCKMELFLKLKDMASEYRLKNVIDGTNYSDLTDVRYGRKAAKKIGVKSPLLAAKITKEDIRKYSKHLKLSTWHKPSFACLASRIPFGTEITKKDLLRIERAEDYLRKLGFYQVRVRIHKDIARLEISKADFVKAIKLNSAIVKRLKELGFVYIALDLGGYCTGSMHKAIVE